MSEQTKKQKTKGSSIGRVLWVILRNLLVPVLCVAALIIGVEIGYVVIGKQQAVDVFHWDTWKHLYDLVFTN